MSKDSSARYSQKKTNIGFKYDFRLCFLQMVFIFLVYYISFHHCTFLYYNHLLYLF